MQATQLLPLPQGRPNAFAQLHGHGITGSVRFYQTAYGVLVYAQVRGLPETPTQIYGFHIHEGRDCGPAPYENALGHFNPGSLPHPRHAGDLPPLFGNRGFAILAFLTDRFRADQIIGRTVIVHRAPDDFTTQPAGASGDRIACGLIKRT